MKKIIHGWKLSKNTNVCKNIGNNMDDIIHGMWSGNQGFREGVKIHDSTHPKELKSFQFYQFLLPTKIYLKALSTAQNEHKTPRVYMDLSAKLKTY